MEGLVSKEELTAAAAAAAVVHTIDFIFGSVSSNLQWQCALLQS